MTSHTQFEPIVRTDFGRNQSDQTILDAIKIALANRSTIEMYIHIPFCQEICTFCPYAKTARHLSDEKLQDYVDSVQKEIGFFSSYLRPNSIDVLFIGGGTPSMLTAEQLWSLVSQLWNNGFIRPNAEFTVECLPSHVSKLVPELASQASGKLKVRISTGVQTLDSDVMVNINRHSYSVDETKNSLMVLHQLYKKGFIANFNVDLMTGLPGQSIESAMRDVNFLLELGVPSITLEYTRIMDGTALSKQAKSGKLRQFRMQDAEISQTLDKQRKLLKENGFIPNSPLNRTTWVLPGHERHYQIGYQLGFGASAITTLPSVKYQNVKDQNTYQRLIEANQLAIEQGGVLSPQSAVLLQLQIELGQTGGLSFVTIDNLCISDDAAENIINKYFDRQQKQVRFLLRDVSKGRDVLRDLSDLILRSY